MFPSEKGTRLNLHNVLNRMILPVLNVCVTRRKSKSEHAQDMPTTATPRGGLARLACIPPWTRNKPPPLRCSKKEVHSILRPANPSTTMNIYVKSVSAESVAAMGMLEAVLCTDCAPKNALTRDVMVE